MSIEEEIKSKVREISRDLEEDRELQLDVEMELESHLCESYDNALERGLSEVESKEHAFKEFGGIAEVKSRIVSGNLKRMKSRARLKMVLWFVFLPISILSALYLGWSELSELRMVNDLMRSDSRLIAQVDKESPILKIRELENSGESFDQEAYQFLLKQFPDNAYIESLWLAAHYNKCCASVEIRQYPIFC